MVSDKIFCRSLSLYGLDKMKVGCAGLPVKGAIFGQNVAAYCACSGDSDNDLRGSDVVVSNVNCFVELLLWSRVPFGTKCVGIQLGQIGPVTEHEFCSGGEESPQVGSYNVNC